MVYFLKEVSFSSLLVELRISRIEWQRIKNPTPMSINEMPYSWLLACCCGNREKSTARIQTLVMTNRSDRNAFMLIRISFSSIWFVEMWWVWCDSTLDSLLSNVTLSDELGLLLGSRISTSMRRFDLDVIDLYKSKFTMTRTIKNISLQLSRTVT